MADACAFFFAKVRPNQFLSKKKKKIISDCFHASLLCTRLLRNGIGLIEHEKEEEEEEEKEEEEEEEEEQEEEEEEEEKSLLENCHCILAPGSCCPTRQATLEINSNTSLKFPFIIFPLSRILDSTSLQGQVWSGVWKREKSTSISHGREVKKN